MRAAAGWAIAAAIALGGCGALGRIAQSTERAVESIDRAILSLQAESEAFRDVLQQLVAQLEPGRVRAELEVLLARTIQTAGQETRCTADFLAARVREALVSLKTELLGGAPYQRRPVFCTAVPSSIDLAAWRRGEVTSVTVSGYDLDQVDAFAVRLRGITGTRELAAAPLVNRAGPYELVLNLRQELVPLRDDSLQLVVDGERGPALELAITRAPDPACDTRTVPAGALPVLELVPQTRAAGDSDFKGHGPILTASVDLFVEEERRIVYRLRFRAVETRSDWTRVEGERRGQLYALTPQLADYQISNIRPGLRSETPAGGIRYTTPNHAPQPFHPAEGPVDQFIFVGDTDGSDVGRTGVKALMRPLQLELTRVRNCARP